MASRVRYVSPIGRVSPRFWAWPFSPFSKSRYHGLFRGASPQRRGAHGPAPAAASQAADRAFPPGPAHPRGRQARARASWDETPGVDTRCVCVSTRHPACVCVSTRHPAFGERFRSAFPLSRHVGVCVCRLGTQRSVNVSARRCGCVCGSLCGRLEGRKEGIVYSEVWD